MRRFVGWLTLLGLMAGAGCATYRDDLDRSIRHYNAREYDRAVVLLEVLESDTNSLSEAERTQYAYYRGMSHFLLEQRLDARHWLARAAARDKTAKALHPDEKKKIETTLTELNKEVYGLAAAVPAAASCKNDSDCAEGESCDDGHCKAPKKEGEADAAGKEGDAATKADAGARSTGSKADAGAKAENSGKSKAP